MQYDLSVIVPARNEEWLAQTIERLVERKRGNTEVIVVCDGYWPDPEVRDYDDVRVIHLSEPIGQRAAQNLGVKLSTAKYVMKLDAHCDMSEGFDVEMLKAFEEVGDNVTMTPMMLNLWVFDWKCKKCGSRWYQGPAPVRCMKRGKNTSEVLEHPECDGTNFTKRLVFKPRPDTPHSTSFRFDSDLHFQYFQEYKDRQEGDLVESMSLQGSCFMSERSRYWKLDLCDQSWGSWGNQGTEVACKSWLSGGRVIINKRCTQAHLFRTQPGFSFPYQQSGRGQQNARDICNDIFKNNKWEHQTLPLSWLVDKFSPVPGWSDEDVLKIRSVPLNPQPSILPKTD